MIAGDEGQSAPRLQSTSVSCDAAKFPIIYPGPLPCLQKVATQPTETGG